MTKFLAGSWPEALVHQVDRTAGHPSLAVCGIRVDRASQITDDARNVTCTTCLATAESRCRVCGRGITNAMRGRGEHVHPSCARH